MNIRRVCFQFSLSIAALALLAVSVVHADDVIFDDSFADGDLTMTGPNDTNWWTSSSSSALDQDTMVANQLDFITGTSGRGIHTVFATQTLNVGDRLTATYTFTTPTTINSSGGVNGAFRVGLFDTLGRAGLNANVSASSGTPNELYGWSADNGGSGSTGLPGYMLDMDVNLADESDLNFREHNIGSATGRLMATTGSGSFSSFSSGPDAGYEFASNTSYTGTFSVERISDTEMMVSGSLGSDSYSIIDDSFDSASFGLLGFHANSNKFGSSNAAGDDDNGLDFTNISVVFTAAVPEPGTTTFLLGGLISLGFVRRRKWTKCFPFGINTLKG